MYQPFERSVTLLNKVLLPKSTVRSKVTVHVLSRIVLTVRAQRFSLTSKVYCT